MGPDEPSREIQDRFHQRILENDVTAFAEFCEAVFPYLISYLRRSFPLVEEHMRETIAIDDLLAYKLEPQKYDPTKASLIGYLQMAARMDMLNAIDKEKRRQQHLSSFEEHLLQDRMLDEDLAANNSPFENWLQDYQQLSYSELLDGLDSFLNETEKKVLKLMLEGVRETDPYAETLELTHLDVKSRRKEVKRVKDRLIKKLRRYGKSIKNT
jgi:hypothetical protein